MRQLYIITANMSFEFRFVFKVMPRRLGENGIRSFMFRSSSQRRRESDAGIFLHKSRSIPTQPKMGSLASCFAPQAEGVETKEGLECEAE
jgi:hypothetical protein